jgi:pimeloyl-ACP methyl ester carboxylesterase
MARSQTLPYGILPPSNCSATATRPWRPLCHCAAFTLSEYLSSILTTVEGPFVLVGHSYGGSVISHPIFTKHALKSLVFISAFLQDSGEAAGELNGRWPGSKLGETTTIVRLYPGGNDLYLKAESFAEVYAGDLSPQQAKVLAAAQRSIDPKDWESPLWGLLHGAMFPRG